MLARLVLLIAVLSVSTKLMFLSIICVKKDLNSYHCLLCYDVKMGNDPIYCLNNIPEKESECIYKECQMYSEELDLCKLELLKSSPKKATTERKPIRDEPQRLPERGDSPLQKIVPGDFVKEVTVMITSKPEAREVNTSNGPTGLAEFTVSDGEATAKMTVWEPLHESVLKKAIGTKIKITSLGSKQYKDEFQLSSTRKSAISYP